MLECSVHELNQRVASGDVILIDVREYPEYAAGRIAGSKLIPLGDLVHRAAEVDAHSEIHLICRTGRRSAEGTRQLRSLGYERVINVAGGFEAWRKENLPFERDERAPWSIERQVRFTAGVLVLIGVLLSIFVHPYFVVLAGLIGFGLAFTATIDWCAMGILISKLPWNRRAI